MSPPRLSVLQVNTTDIGGGAAAIAFSHHLQLRNRGCDAWLAVGSKRSGESRVFEISRTRNQTQWDREWTRIAQALTPLARRVRGGGRIQGLLRAIGNPTPALNRKLGRDDFDFPGTKNLLSQVPQKIDVLHFHNLHGGYFDLRSLPGLTRSVPAVITLHDTWMLSGHSAETRDFEQWKNVGAEPRSGFDIPGTSRNSTTFNLKRKRAIYAQARLVVVTPSEWLAALARQSILATAASKFCVIPNGIDRSIFRPGDKRLARQKLSIPEEVRLIVFAAAGIRANMFKDFGTIRSALTVLSGAMSTGQFEFIGIGEEGPSEYFSNGRITLVPHVERSQLVQYYQAADVYFHASRMDNFPNSVLEALCCGTPVLATAVGGIPEQVRSLNLFDSGIKEETFAVEGATGVLVNAGDGAGMGKAAAWLLERPQILAQLSNNARVDAAKRFDINLQTDRYLELYDRMLGNRTTAT